MHFHDSFIAYFFLVLSLSRCHKQSSSVPHFFIIHKSNKVVFEKRSVLIRRCVSVTSVSAPASSVLSFVHTNLPPFVSRICLTVRTLFLYLALCSLHGQTRNNRNDTAAFVRRPAKDDIRRSRHNCTNNFDCLLPVDCNHGYILASTLNASPAFSNQHG